MFLFFPDSVQHLYIFIPYFWSKIFLTWRTKWPGCGSGCVCTRCTCVASGCSEASLVQLWGSPTHLRPPGETSQSGTKRPRKCAPFPWGVPPGVINVMPCLWNIPQIFSSPELCVCDVRPGYIKPIAERTRDDGSHGHMAAMLQKEWKIQGTSGTVIHLTYPE